MNITTIAYPGYTIEMPDGLTKPFQVFSTVLSSIEYDHPIDLLGHPVTVELIEKCKHCVSAAIGKAYSHDLKIEDALACWTDLSEFERVVYIVQAANNTEPLDLGLAPKSSGFLGDI